MLRLHRYVSHIIKPVRAYSRSGFEEVVERMVREIPDARRVDVAGVNHYGIVFQPNELRDRAILNFMEE